ncbi:MAG: MBL fold metallo-hydrolase [Clostridia bacterium]|nr:MBL fold metallo-hydrolase [Clostridia bacterium]
MNRTGYSRLSALLILLLLVMCSVSCSGGDGVSVPGVTTAPIAETTAAPEAEPLALIRDGAALFRVVRAEKAGDGEVAAATQIRQDVKNLTGITPEIATDWIGRGESYDSTTVEILVGQTGYPESAEVLASTAYGDYTIAVQGNKLVVAAWDNHALKAGVDALVALLHENYADGLLAVPRVSQTKTADRILSAIPTLAGGKLEYIQEAGVPSGEKAMQITLSDVEAAEYAAYRDVLNEAGYVVMQENTIGENRYLTLSRENRRLTVYHMGLLDQVRIISEPARPISPEPAAYTAVCDTTLMQLGLEEGKDLAGAMNAYVVQLADGRFVLMDTGTEAAAPYLYQYMKERTPAGEKIRIAAAFISHPHVDHMDGLKAMAEKYRREMECEAVYINYGAFSMQSRYVESTFRGHWESMTAAARFLGAELYVLRTGQRIEIANAVFEVLWCPEDFGNRIIEDYNNACVVVRMTVGDSKTIFLGDCRDQASPIVVAMYGDALKCDMITVAHHGYGGSVFPLYKLASASVVFWPNTYYDSRTVNEQILAMDCVEHHYLAGDGDVVVTIQTKD